MGQSRPCRYFTKHWPAYVITVSTGLFCAVVGILWVAGHVFNGDPIDATAWIILAATLLRLVTVVIALASVRGWGRRLPPGPLLAALWGCSAAQLVYPLTELAAKVLVLAGMLDLPPSGIGNMSGVGWFNLAMVWLIFGVPGALFAAAAVSYRNRRPAARGWIAAGIAGGTAVLFGIGLVIG